jgi:hypothetical protein
VPPIAIDRLLGSGFKVRDCFGHANHATIDYTLEGTSDLTACGRDARTALTAHESRRERLDQLEQLMFAVVLLIGARVSSSAASRDLAPVVVTPTDGLLRGRRPS